MTTADPKQVTKVVLGLKDGAGSIGIQATGCDPHFKIVGAEAIQLAQRLAAERTIPVELTAMDIVLSIVPEALEEAQTRWSDAEQNPSYARPTVAATQPAQPATGGGRRTGRQTPAAPSGPTQQPLL